jgi:GNAT superfamily N-acetyltransferase
MKKSIRCNIKYHYIKKGNYEFVWLYNLFIDPILRRRGLAKIMIEETIKEIKNLYPNIRILLEAEPFADKPMSNTQLKKFYKKFKDITIVKSANIDDIVKSFRNKEI